MTKIYLLTSIVIVSAIIVICAIPECNGVISDKRLCYDPECSEPVSMARTLVRYNSIEPHILSFPTNMQIVIFSKEAGKNRDLWGAEVHGKRGYIPKRLVREYKTFKSNLTHEVPTEFPNEVNTTDKVKVDVPSEADGSELDIEANSTAGESQSSEEIEKENEVNNGTTNESETFKEPEKNPELDTTGDNPSSTVDSSDSPVKESIEQRPEEVLEEGVQSVTPSFEVIDGTTIPVLHDEIPIKPSYSTPIIAATATPDEGPILSVHPSLPATVRPLISSFSKSGSQTTVGDNLNAESNVSAENETDETDSKKQSVTIQNGVVDPKIDESVVDEKSTVENDSKTEVLGNNNHAEDTETAEITQPADNSTEKSEKGVNDAEKDENNEIKSSHDKSDTSSSEKEVLPAVEAAGSSAHDTRREELDVVENITDTVENENVNSNTNESVEDVVETDLGGNTIEQGVAKFNDNVPETIEGKSEIEEAIQEQELERSKTQTENLSYENVTDTSNKDVEGSNNVEDKIMLKRADLPLTSQTVEQNDSQVIVSNEANDHNESFTVHSADEVGGEAKVEDHSENTSQEGVVKNYSPFNFLNPGSEEVTTEFYSTLEEEKPTTSRSLLTVEEGLQYDDNQSSTETFDIDEPDSSEIQTSQDYNNETYDEGEVLEEAAQSETVETSTESTLFSESLNIQVAPAEVCDINSDCTDIDKDGTAPNEKQDAGGEEGEEEEDEQSHSTIFEQHNYLETLLYLSITALTTLLFSLGYYYIENQRRDKELVAKINILEKELLVTTKESMMLDEGLKATKHKLDSIEDESFGSNEMVLSLKLELEAAQVTKGELEDQIVTLERELESASEAGLELERMLREFLASQSDENPLAQSVEDLQTRLNAQQATNESLTNNLNLKSQENEALTSELAFTQERCQQLEVEITRLSGELKTQSNLKNNADKEFSAKIVQLNKQINKLSEERAGLITQLTAKEMALNDLSELVKQECTESFDFEKLYDVSHVKAAAEQVTKERDELKMKLIEVEGAYQLLEEHMKLIKEEIASVTEQYELAERDKTEAQTRLEVLSNYFKEKESQLQKELGMQEAMWVQKQGEVTSTVDRIQTMQNEIQNYRQQIETLKREILDQEREYKSQIAALETKSHEQWVIARQSERRLEESKAEASQLRNRLTMVEKSINEVDTDSKLHRLETNGETASSPQLFMGAETSSSPILFTGSSGVPPLPPSYMYGAPLPPPFIPPPPHSGGGPMYDISRRPPPLGGRLSSPPPIPPLHHPPGRYEDASSPPPPLSPPLHPPYNHRSPPPFSNDRIHPHLNPPPPFLPPLGTHSWGDEPLPPLRNSVFHPHQREQRLRNHKGSLHSSGDSLDKTNHTGKS